MEGEGGRTGKKGKAKGGRKRGGQRRKERRREGGKGVGREWEEMRNWEVREGEGGWEMREGA